MRRVTHEIRNHLAVAIANVEAFRDGVLEPSPQRLSSVLQALREVENLLGELTPGQIVPPDALATNAQRINVCDVITNEVLAFEAAAAENQIAFRVQQCTVHGPECVNFTGDPVRVGEIVNNVVSNAMRYTPPGGQIDVDCRPSDGILTLTVTDGAAAHERAAGSYSWGGIDNTHFWVDPKTGIGVIVLTQVLPFYNPVSMDVVKRFERGTFESFKTDALTRLEN